MKAGNVVFVCLAFFALSYSKTTIIFLVVMPLWVFVTLVPWYCLVWKMFYCEFKSHCIASIISYFNRYFEINSSLVFFVSADFEQKHCFCFNDNLKKFRNCYLSFLHLKIIPIWCKVLFEKFCHFRLYRRNNCSPGNQPTLFECL